ncbi:ankyrin [Aspergillus heteromorphus CBS 117.55]|uniref:Ankyrin n=1 Tax=Aspergillus heteromorphus CBS 117.55 TaxID=1448321 RepID=A0A317VZ49_9EURO|nr:ankyrin [Aspergillus heteromorphus CBS 117.55]PWY78237.1 ankyrin [Aspergillus heteromorphus CBS 117.55]
MSLNCLPNELVVEIGLFLEPRSLASLIQSAKRYAWLLTPRLYDFYLQRTYCYGLDQVKLWSSPYVVKYFQGHPSNVSHMYNYGTLLHQFAEAGNLCLLNILLSRGAHVNAKAESFVTPLHLAASEGHVDVAQALIDAGADINARDENNETPLYNAISEKRRDMIPCLINSGANIFAGQPLPFEDAIYDNMPEFSTLLIQAIKSAGPDIDTLNEEDCTMLHVAAKAGCVTTVQLLLDNNADPFRTTPSGCTALHLACQRGHTQVAKLLLNAMRHAGHDAFAQDTLGYTPLLSAVESCTAPLVQLLIDYGDSISASGEYALQLVNWRKIQVHVLSLLLRHKLPAVLYEVIQTRFRTEAEHMMYQGFPTQPQLLFLERALQMVKSHETTINLSASRGTGPTILHYLCKLAFKSNEIHELLCAFFKADADVDICDPRGDTPIHMILKASNRYKNLKLVHLMIDSSNDINKLKEDRSSYLHWAAMSGHPRTVQLLLDRMDGSTIVSVNNRGETALHMAAKAANHAAVQQLLTSHINVNAQDIDGKTAMHVVAGLAGASTAHLLVEGGADMTAIDGFGNPPVHYAVGYENAEMVDFFIGAGAAVHEGCFLCTDCLSQKPAK